MALISDSKSSGSELERLILDRVQHIDDLDRFLEQEIMQEWPAPGFTYR